MAELYPMLIQPRYDERIWGGHALAETMGKDAPDDRPIGESWEIYEENRVLNGAFAGRTIGDLRREMGRDLMGHVAPDELFPLLTKLIDAQDVLSVQVHPDDRFARELEGQPYGKTECWYILQAAPGAELIYGFSRDTSPEEYRRLVVEGKLEQVLRRLQVQAGDVIYLPARIVHAIGAGIVLFELQQTSDTTYRIYDWNRRDSQGKPRELHVDKASQVLDYHAWTRGPVQPLTGGDEPCRTVLIGSRYFCLEHIDAGRGRTISTYGSPVALCALGEPLRIRAGESGEAQRLERFSSVLVPAAAGSYSIESGNELGPALAAYVPESQGAVRDDLVRRGFAPRAVDAFLAQFDPAG